MPPFALACHFKFILDLVASQLAFLQTFVSSRISKDEIIVYTQSPVDNVKGQCLFLVVVVTSYIEIIIDNCL